MNQYLLLRDNKQTGPYSVEELKSKGLKAYDLVWLDGKSAAWRYPSEIEELKAFAPAVEEQPYDRFYKKKPAHQVAALTTTATIVTSAIQTTIPQVGEVVMNKPVVANTTQQPVAAKKIYVTLPAGMSQKPAPVVTVSDKGQLATTDQDKAEAAAQHASEELLNEKFARLREEKIRQAANKAANPAVNKLNTGQDLTPAPVFSEIVEQNHPQPSERLATAAHHRQGNSRLIMRSIAAACLLLGGVIIGLVISNSRQQKDQAALDQLVKQIQERDRQKREQAAFTAPVNPPAEPTVQPEQVATDQSVTPGESVARKAASIGAAVSTHPASPALKESMPVKDVSQRQTVKVIPALVTNKTEEKPVNSQDAEKARKNIHQLVALDANKYKIGVLGGISELQLTISNNSLYPLDQVEVELRYLGPEKRIVKTQTLLFNDVAPGEQKTVEAPRTNRGVAVDYVITRINSKALGLAHAGY